MGIFSGLAAKKRHFVNRQNPATFPEYMFNQVSIPLPGPAYYTPLLQFQSYPKNLVQGGPGHGGVLVQRFFKSYEAQYSNAQLAPVIGATQGQITGQVFSQPLTDTSQVNAGTVS